MHVRPVVYGTTPPFVLTFREDRGPLARFLAAAGIPVVARREDAALWRLDCPASRPADVRAAVAAFLAGRPAVPRAELTCAAAAAAGCFAPPPDWPTAARTLLAAD
jgi:hypothetical protein